MTPFSSSSRVLILRTPFLPGLARPLPGAGWRPQEGSGGETRPKGRIKIHGVVASAVNARDLHAFLEDKKDFSNWIKKQIDPG